MTGTVMLAADPLAQSPVRQSEFSIPRISLPLSGFTYPNTEKQSHKGGSELVSPARSHGKGGVDSM